MTHSPLNLDDLRQRARQALEEASSRNEAYPDFQGHSWASLLEELNVYHAELEIQNEQLVEAQSAIVRSLNTYRLLFDCLPQPAVLLDSRGFIEEANAQAIELLGLSSIMAKGRWSIIQFFDANSRSLLHPLLRPSTEPGAFPPIHARIRTGGEGFPCAVHVIHLPGEEGKSTRILLVMADLRGELSLRENESLRQVLEHSPIPMAAYSLDAKREVQFINEEFTRIFGYTLEDLPTVDRWAELAFPDPDYRRQSFAWWDEAIEHACCERGAVPSREFRVVRKDGFHRDVRISAAVSDHSVIVSFVDVTEQNETQEKLRQSEARHRLWADNSADVVWTMGLDGRFTYISPSVAKVLGRTPDETMAMPWEDIFTPDSLTLVQQGFARALADVAAGRPVQFRERLEERRGLGGDATVWTDVMATSLYDAEGRCIEILGITRDITEQKRIEDELRSTRDRLEATLDALPDLMLRVDRQGRIHDCHIAPGCDWCSSCNALESIRDCHIEGRTPYQLPPKEILGRSLTEILPESASRVVREALSEAAERGSHRGGSYALSTPEGVIWHELSIAAMGDTVAEEAEFILMARDITQRKDYEHELELARDAALKANQAKSRFLAHMSHEIRTPMNGVLGMAQILTQEALTPDQQQMVDTILSAGRSLLGIINDILDLSKIEAGQLQLDPHPFDLNQTLEHVRSIGEVNARAKGIALRLVVDPAIAGGWLGDALRLEQVLFNLTGNAIKFTETGEVVIQVRPLELGAGRGRLRFEIVDTGIGLDAEAVARLFTPFSQAEASITRRFGGTGLGLSISKRLVELMGGEIGVRSTPGVGSVFWFDWPAGRVALPEAGASDGHESEPQGKIDLRGLRLLVVDDSATNRFVAQRLLTTAGADCALANDGEQALSRLREKPQGYDVVLMDIQMPVMDGLTALRAIREDPALAGLPVLALSAGVLEEERESALAAGMDDFVTKPLNLRQLCATLARFLPGD